MPWADSYRFDEPMERVPDRAMADLLMAEPDREVGPGHPLHGRKWTPVARALPQDEVLVTSDDDVALVPSDLERQAGDAAMAGDNLPELSGRVRVVHRRPLLTSGRWLAALSRREPSQPHRPVSTR